MTLCPPGTSPPLLRLPFWVATVTDMITSFDDFPIHQTSAPIAHAASGDPGHYDRYFYNGYSHDGALFFAVAMGLYPNRHVMDAAFSVVYKGEQISVHASARAPHDRLQCTKVGPIHVDVKVPLKLHTISVNSPEHGITAEVTFHAASLPFEEPPFLQRVGNRVTMDYTRLTQLGAWSGWIEIDGVRQNLTPDAHKGSRDRSWGIRNVGERVQLGAPIPQAPQFFWLWAPVCFDGFGTMFDLNEYADGQRWHESGAMLIGADTIKNAHKLEYQYTWEPGTRRAEAFDLTYEFADTSSHLHFEPLVHFQMLGLGYLHPEWGHGFHKGDLAVGGERFTVPVPDPLAMHHLHTQTVSRVTCQNSDGTTHEGIGVLETLVIGAHAPSGFVGMDDGYRL